jgi:hypothetical protein
MSRSQQAWRIITYHSIFIFFFLKGFCLYGVTRVLFFLKRFFVYMEFFYVAEGECWSLTSVIDKKRAIRARRARTSVRLEQTTWASRDRTSVV